MERRHFLQRGAAGAVGSLIGARLFSAAFDEHAFIPSAPVVEGPGTWRFVQRPLPYAYGALEPHIDTQTMRIHFEKHHAKYVEEANKELTSAALRVDTPEVLFASISRSGAKLRNNAGGAWNHDFFWYGMRAADAGNGIPGALRDALAAAFGSVDVFREKFAEEALGRFGSGWTWLVATEGKLRYGSTRDQDNPLMDDCPLRGTPLLGLDVWEHAYCLRYQNKRVDYITNWWNIVDWNAVAERLSTAK